jgi:hypothetical protein
MSRVRAETTAIKQVVKRDFFAAQLAKQGTVLGAFCPVGHNALSGDECGIGDKHGYVANAIVTPGRIDF